MNRVVLGAMVVSARVSVIVLNWNGRGLLPQCLDATLAQAVAGGVHVWLVDNGSADGSEAFVRERYPQVRVVQTGANLGFAGGNNAALRLLNTEYVALLNNDAVPRPGWLAALVAELDVHPQAAAAAAKVLLTDPPGALNSAGGWVDRRGHGRDRGYLQPDGPQWERAASVFYAPATACLYRTAALREVGLLDAAFFLYYEDVDLSWRLRLAGHDIRYVPAAVADHQHSASAVTDSRVHTFHDARNRLLMLAKLAPALMATQATIRLPQTAAGALGRGELRRALWLAQAWLSYLRLLPAMLRARRDVGARARVSRADVAAWCGREELGP